MGHLKKKLTTEAQRTQRRQKAKGKSKMAKVKWQKAKRHRSGSSICLYFFLLLFLCVLCVSVVSRFCSLRPEQLVYQRPQERLRVGYHTHGLNAAAVRQ